MTMATLTALSTLIFLVVFIGIVCWAWSGGRRHANREAAWLPFALPDEAGSDNTSDNTSDNAARPQAIEQGH